MMATSAAARSTVNVSSIKSASSSVAQSLKAGGAGRSAEAGSLASTTSLTLAFSTSASSTSASSTSSNRGAAEPAYEGVNKVQNAELGGGGSVGERPEPAA